MSIDTEFIILLISWVITFIVAILYYRKKFAKTSLLNKIQDVLQNINPKMAYVWSLLCGIGKLLAFIIILFVFLVMDTLVVHHILTIFWPELKLNINPLKLIFELILYKFGLFL
jgi:hypothetical protein